MVPGVPHGPRSATWPQECHMAPGVPHGPGRARFHLSPEIADSGLWISANRLLKRGSATWPREDHIPPGGPHGPGRARFHPSPEIIGFLIVALRPETNCSLGAKPERSFPGRRNAGHLTSGARFSLSQLE
jgi:hypothetical protein